MELSLEILPSYAECVKNPTYEELLQIELETRIRQREYSRARRLRLKDDPNYRLKKREQQKRYYDKNKEKMQERGRIHYALKKQYQVKKYRLKTPYRLISNDSETETE